MKHVNDYSYTEFGLSVDFQEVFQTREPLRIGHILGFELE